MNTNEPFNINTIMNTKVTVPADILQNLKQYVAGDTDPLLYSVVQKTKLALVEYFYKLQSAGRTLYHMSITYKPFQGRVYTEKDVNTFYINFYTKKFLPHLMGTRNYHTNGMRLLQPITYCFVDEHEHKAGLMTVKNIQINNKRLPVTVFAVRLHHHAILAVDDYSRDKIESLVGVNTLSNGKFTHKIMTSDIKQCDAQRVVYASKMLWKYPDFMSFPDTFKKHRNRVSH